MPRTEIDLSEAIDITTSPEAAGVIVTYDRGDARATDRLTMHADGMLYQYRSTNDGWQLNFVLGRITGKKTFNPRDAAWHLELLAERQYGKHLISVSKDY
jgi:hypothetical protein